VQYLALSGLIIIRVSSPPVSPEVIHIAPLMWSFVKPFQGSGSGWLFWQS